MKLHNLNNCINGVTLTRMTIMKGLIQLTLIPDEQRNELVISTDANRLNIIPLVSNMATLQMIDDDLNAKADFIVTSINGAPFTETIHKLHIHDENDQKIGFSVNNEGQLYVATVARIAIIPHDANTVSVKNI